MTELQWAAIGTVSVYLLLFFLMSAVAARAAGQSIWLIGSATGTEKLAAICFRSAFAIVIIGPVLVAVFPPLAEFDLLHSTTPFWVGQLGHIFAVAGAMLAFAAQVSMGASWRVGVNHDAVGALVSGGLYDYSRNPTFVGQGMLMIGTALVVPSLLTFAGVVLFSAAAQMQVKSEERTLLNSYGDRYRSYLHRVPRWFGWKALDRK